MKSRQIALCGLLIALAVVVMILSGAIGIGTFAGPVLAMVILLPLLEEYGARTALAAWAAAALLALLLAADREMALIYLCFGWYPVIRPRIARIRPHIGGLMIRLSLCNGILFLLYGVLMTLLGLASVESSGGRWFTALLLLLGNAVFLLLDPVLLRMTALWHKKIRKLVFHHN